MRWIDWGRSTWLVFFFFPAFCWFLASTSIAFYYCLFDLFGFCWLLYSLLLAIHLFPSPCQGCERISWQRHVVVAQGAETKDGKPGGENDECLQKSGQIIIFHQPRFPWNKGISLAKPPFRVRSCEVAIIWPEKSNGRPFLRGYEAHHGSLNKAIFSGNGHPLICMNTDEIEGLLIHV